MFGGVEILIKKKVNLWEKSVYYTKSKNMTYDPINNDTKNSRQPKKINKKNSIIHEKGQSQATIESSNHLNKPIKAQINPSQEEKNWP